MAIMLMVANPCIAAAAPSIGAPPPALSLPNLQNKTVNLSDFRGKPTILAFFASWSKSCKHQIKALNEIIKENKASGINILGVSFDKNINDLESFSYENKIEFSLLLDRKLKSIDKYAILILPTTIVIGKNGLIADIFVDFDENVDQAIRKFVSLEVSK